MTQSGFDDFERLVRENQRVAYQIAYGVLGNAADAQDVTQDAFLRAYGKLSVLREPARFRAWICRIARRLALNRLRTNVRSRAREELASRETVRPVDVEALAEEREFAARLQLEIGRLPEKLRDVLMLCAVEDLEPGAVATLLGIPQGTVRSRLHLARKRLLQVLAT
ncbi:MAG TPA: sigma-70 family RNA polymerase sigma factor [Candidatus Baltobacteraceae bacterium]|nr:sigma-70 family RNA polymerase sigma factor [Candidatus Baltobacteraceae bacterium]